MTIIRHNPITGCKITTICEFIDMLASDVESFIAAASVAIRVKHIIGGYSPNNIYRLQKRTRGFLKLHRYKFKQYVYNKKN